MQKSRWDESPTSGKNLRISLFLNIRLIHEPYCQSTKSSGDIRWREFGVSKPLVSGNTSVNLSQRMPLFQRWRKKRYLEPGFPVLWQAVTAIDWSALCWLKGDFAFATAI